MRILFYLSNSMPRKHPGPRNYWNRKCKCCLCSFSVSVASLSTSTSFPPYFLSRPVFFGSSKGKCGPWRSLTSQFIALEFLRKTRYHLFQVRVSRWGLRLPQTRVHLLPLVSQSRARVGALRHDGWWCIVGVSLNRGIVSGSFQKERSPVFLQNNNFYNMKFY